MEAQIESAVKVFEEIEKLRSGCEAKLTHLANNRRCLDCGKDWMPKRYELCPQCESKNTKLIKQRRKCLDCGHIWQPSALGVCLWCGSANSQPKPRDDPYLRQVAVPRLRAEEEFYEEQLKEMVKSHPAWQWAKLAKGIGPTTVGRIIAKTDIYRMNTISEMWAHCGFGLSRDGRPQRKHAGQIINYNPQLQSNCVVLGESLLRQRDSYYEYFLRQKDAHSNLPPAWRHNRAFRHMIKLFLAHFWEVWRRAEGLPAPLPYAFTILKHPEGHLIRPEDMIARKLAIVTK